MPSPLPLLSLRQVSTSADGQPMLRELSMDVAPAEFLALLGPSGAGKTALLALIAGLARADAGEIIMQGAPMSRAPLHRRGIGMVLPMHRLIPTMTLAEALIAPLQMRGVPACDHPARVTAALAAAGLPGCHDLLPAELDPAGRQRGLLARALVLQPLLLLLDEPFAGLDRPARAALRADVRRLQRRLGIAIILATNDQAEALSVADRIAVFDAGRLRQIGAPADIYDAPADAFVAGFLGDNNLLPGHVEAFEDDLARIRLECGAEVEARPVGVAQGDACLLAIRPERIALAPVSADDMGEAAIPATLQDTEFYGDQVQLRLEIGVSGWRPATLLVKRPSGLRPVGLAAGQPACVAWQPYDAQAFPAHRG